MSNPKWVGQGHCPGVLNLQAEMTNGVLFTIDGYKGGCFLSHKQVDELIAQLTEWSTTGDWIKPKKKYVVINKETGDCWISETCKKGVGFGKDVYELTEENRIE